ncbi:MAG: hypothetical protein DRN07_05270, partial [Thermoplasmata archaeon]
EAHQRDAAVLEVLQPHGMCARAQVQRRAPIAAHGPPTVNHQPVPPHVGAGLAAVFVVLDDGGVQPASFVDAADRQRING